MDRRTETFRVWREIGSCLRWAIFGPDENCRLTRGRVPRYDHLRTQEGRQDSLCRSVLWGRHMCVVVLVVDRQKIFSIYQNFLWKNLYSKTSLFYRFVIEFSLKNLYSGICQGHQDWQEKSSVRTQFPQVEIHKPPERRDKDGGTKEGGNKEGRVVDRINPVSIFVLYWNHVLFRFYHFSFSNRWLLATTATVTVSLPCF